MISLSKKNLLVLLVVFGLIHIGYAQDDNSTAAVADQDEDDTTSESIPQVDIDNCRGNDEVCYANFNDKSRN